jgi:hypothetical protein
LTTQTTQQINFELHPKQLEIFKDKHRFQIAECGRRFGKTQLAWVKCLTYMAEHPKSLLWWVAPLYKELRPATKTVRDITPKNWISKISEQKETIQYLKIFNGAECFFHSADREDSLRGSGLHGLVVDEAPMLKETRWSAELEPSLMDYDGWALFIGTPKGRNWFSRLKAKGDDPLDQHYKSWRLDSYWNTIEKGGFLKKASIDIVANDLPELIRRQEIYAEELEGAGVVFRHINRQIKPIKPFNPQVPEQLVIGTDYGKTIDFTVHIALRMNGELVGFDRYNTIDWTFQRSRTKNFQASYNKGRLMIDSTGLGDPIYDELRHEAIQVDGFKITSSTKKELIMNLSMMLDSGLIWFNGISEVRNSLGEILSEAKIDPELEILKSELEMFAYEIMPSGNIEYGAPEGFHDDCVIGLALAAWQLKSLPKHEVLVGKIW